MNPTLSPLLALLLAFVIDLTLGDPPNRWHPVTLMGRLIHALTQRWNRGTNAARFRKGALLTLLGGALFAIPVLLLSAFAARLPWWVAALLTAILLKPTFALRGLLKAGRDVAHTLTEKNLPEARRLTSWHLVSRDTSALSEGQVCSAVVESLAENLADSFTAPLFWFSLGGLPLAWCYRFVNTADAMIGYRTEAFEHFGKFAARLDDVLNWLPARIAGITVVLAAGLTGSDLPNAWRTMNAQHTRTSSPNAGWTMAAMAGALRKKLEKLGTYTLEGGADLPALADIPKAEKIIFAAALLNLLLTGGIILFLTTIA